MHTGLQQLLHFDDTGLATSIGVVPIKINTCAASANAKAKQTITYILYNAIELYAMRITPKIISSVR